MTFNRTWIAPLLVVVLVGGCGSPSTGDDDDVPVDAPPGIDAPLPTGYTRLIGRGWTLQPGQTDTYKCIRLTIPNDTYITSIMAQAPQGTHHTVLSIASGSAAGPDGETDCSVNTLGMVMLYASGVGTAPLDFPTDVGIRIAAGQQIHLNLHLYNTSDQVITGDSAILVKSSPTAPPTLAENVFAGTFQIVVPANSTRNITGSCTATQNYSLFAIWPHMHQIATHQKVERVRGGTPTVLHDLAFNFAEQHYYLQEPEVQVLAGDQIRVTCTYVNNTNQTVTFGDSSNQEMCFAGLYRYPAAGGSIFECSGG